MFQPQVRSVSKLAGVVCIAGFLGGCMVGPDYASPNLSMPLFWSSANNKAATKAPPLAAWWKEFRDPQLDALIEMAVDGNLDVATAKANIRTARANYRSSFGALYPQASASLSATKSGAVNTKSTSSFSAGLTPSWEIDLFGANHRAAEAAKYGLDAADEELRSTLLTLIGDITQNYVKLRGYQARIRLARRTADSQRETAKLTRSKFDAGAVSAVDVERALGSAASTEANLAALEASVLQHVHRLSVLIGKEPGALKQQLRAFKAIPRPKLPLSTGIPADILTNRPDIRVAERQYAQSTAKIGKAEAERYPSISLGGSISTRGNSLGALAKSSSISWSFGPSLTIPVFNGGSLAASVDAAKATRDASFLNYRATVLNALEETENAIVSLAQDRKNLQKLNVAAKHYRKASSLSRSLFEAGSQSVFELLEADRTLYSTETSLIEARVAIAVDYITLNKALGGGWDGEIDASKPEIVDVNKAIPAPSPKRGHS